VERRVIEEHVGLAGSIQRCDIAELERREVPCQAEIGLGHDVMRRVVQAPVDVIGAKPRASGGFRRTGLGSG
jgi:hypothetical protein